MILDCCVNQKTLGEFQTKVARQLFKPLDLHCGTVDGGQFLQSFVIVMQKIYVACLYHFETILYITGCGM